MALSTLRRSLLLQILNDKYFILLMTIFVIFVVIGIVGPYFVRSPLRTIGPRLQPPSKEYLLGTDALGRDVLSQIVHGIRNSLLIGLYASCIAIMIALVLGLLSGFMRGLVGEVLSAIINIFLLIPQIPLLLLIACAIRIRSMWLVATLIGTLIVWPAPARAIRSLALSIGEREFIDLAKISAKSSLNIVFTELLPNILPYVILQYTTTYASAIFSETGISLIGLGPTNVVTLGWILNQVVVMNAYVVGAWWWFLFPGLAITLLVLSLYLIPLVISRKLQQLGF